MPNTAHRHTLVDQNAMSTSFTLFRSSSQYAAYAASSLLTVAAIAAGGFALASCSESSAAPDPAVGPSKIVWVTDAYAGGQRVLDSTVVDSLTGRWTVTRCGPVAATAPICQPADTRLTNGVVDTTYRRILFQRTRRADFVALRTEYPLIGVVPPDLLVQELKVTVNQRVQTVKWRSGSAPLVTVDSFVCLLQQAMGSLILCAN